MKSNRSIVFAKKSFGQNFLVDQNYVDKIINVLAPKKDEIVFEIGAGRGALTKRLIESGAYVVAIELDRDLLGDLAKLCGSSNLQLISEDALKVDYANLVAAAAESKIADTPKVKVVANLPYNISTAILQKLIVERSVFDEMILMFQAEVVERITAEAGNKQRGYLTVLVEAYLKASRLFDVPPNAFRPVPKVWSSVARLTPRPADEIAIGDDHLFKEIISLGFAHKRKTIQNNLKNAIGPLGIRIEKSGGVKSALEKAGIDPGQRAESLAIASWKAFSNLLS